MEPRKQAIIDALSRFIRQRPGLKFGNCGDVAAYRAECRSIARDKREAQILLTVVSWRDGIDADALIKAAEGAFSGRLTIKLHFATSLPSQIDCDTAPPTASIDYVTGQYWPTEYRRAVCAVLASALWTYTREHAMPPVKGYRVESWAKLELNGRRVLHTVRDTRAEAEAERVKLGGDSYGSVNVVYLSDRFRGAGDWLRAHFRKEFGRGIASRWFS